MFTPPKTEKYNKINQGKPFYSTLLHVSAMQDYLQRD
jgi:hypothetical protein